jgi:acetyl-CoA C-acetyltransferase
MTIDPRTPVLVAVGEVTSRSATVVDPIDLATEATRRAFTDAGVPIGHRIDTVATPGILMIGRDHPASRIAEAAGLRAHRRISCPVGGNTPQYLAGTLGQDIMCGQVDAALIVGAEAGNSARHGGAAGTLPVAGPVEGHDETLGDARPGLSAIEMGAGLHWPHEVYPIFESAMAARAGRTLDEQRVWLGRLMALFTTEAARHPDQAWFPTERTPEERRRSP